ncbi:hypothetical protein OPV22_029590 [Ensete ventricosum]|uniref:Amino acid transporter transmembrane domain-containing protein n=1 Tax=Ensete ventricosum TaxID=4639 RepID=A0AAV8Q9N6_ENSVE|nr:hypothetical protein OPV22_029590 [Ensete ventricosum]
MTVPGRERPSAAMAQPKRLSLVWLCGSLSDLIVQPLVGHQSDRCASPLGRLRPYIAGGAAAIVASVLLIGYSADISHALGDPADGGTRHRAIADYFLGFWLLDVGSNTTQGPCSALLADLTGHIYYSLCNDICMYRTFRAWSGIGHGHFKSGNCDSSAMLLILPGVVNKTINIVDMLSNAFFQFPLVLSNGQQVSTISYKDRLELQQQEREREREPGNWAWEVILVSVCACQKIMLWKGYDGHGMCMEKQTSKATVSQPTTYCLTISRPFPMRLCIVQRAGGREQSARANLDSAIGPPRL